MVRGETPRAIEHCPLVSGSEYKDSSQTDDWGHGLRGASTKTRFISLLILGVLFACAALGFISGVLYHIISMSTDVRAHPSCLNRSFRREWRSLSRLEKGEYIEAVQCLRTVPSRIVPTQTLYDDFPWIHSRIGNYSHGTAAFLAWHRYFIHVYETALKEQCAYTGTLAYWDWTLDWEDMTKSPIWDSGNGFGGNGDLSGETTVGHGHCVTDGPFARLTALFYDKDDNKHCLSRGFLEVEPLHDLWSSNVRPSAVEALLSESDYESFNLGLEEGAHRAIPSGVRGDFFKFSAPYDPVFFLHHTQLDRLWWKWQHLSLQQRIREYSGRSGDGDGMTSLTDVLSMGKLASDVRVWQVMSTDSDLLCYTY